MSDRPATAPTPRTTPSRYPRRVRHDFDTIAAILDEGLICHLGFAIGGEPFMIPTTYARVGRDLYVHGSPAAGWIEHLRSGIPVCVTVTLLDGLVFARSAFHHSMNYRSVVAFGVATAVDDPAEKLAAARAIVEHVAPGRWSDGIRHPSEGELRATVFLKLPLDEASAKVRNGPPLDLEQDMQRAVWSGVLPIAQRTGAPVPDPADNRIPVPVYVSSYRRPSRDGEERA